MPEEKKQVPAGGKDLSSKIAAAYRSIPPEEREKTLHGHEDVQNPELDRTFDKLVETYRTKRGEKAVVPFPRSASPLVRPEGEESPEGEGFECPECGHMNPTANQFCGMCGAAQDESTAAAAQRTLDEPETPGLVSDENKVRHHHHYYHHHHYRNNPYLLLAVVLLLAIIAWQEFREYRPAPLSPAAATQPVRPQVQPPATPAPVEVKPSPAPAAKPAQTTPKPLARATPAFREESPPEQITRTPTPPPASVDAPPESAFRRFISSVTPVFVPTPAVIPSKPAPSNAVAAQQTAPQRVKISQGVSEGRVIKRVQPEYPLIAQRSRITGKVELEAVIDGSGNVQDVVVTQGNPVLADAAVKAVKQWKYQPYMLDGKAVEVDTHITVIFR